MATKQNYSKKIRELTGWTPQQAKREIEKFRNRVGNYQKLIGQPQRKDVTQLFYEYQRAERGYAITPFKRDLISKVLLAPSTSTGKTVTSRTKSKTTQRLVDILQHERPNYLSEKVDVSYIAREKLLVIIAKAKGKADKNTLRMLNAYERQIRQMVIPHGLGVTEAETNAAVKRNAEIIKNIFIELYKMGATDMTYTQFVTQTAKGISEKHRESKQGGGASGGGGGGGGAPINEKKYESY